MLIGHTTGLSVYVSVPYGLPTRKLRGAENQSCRGRFSGQ